MAFKIELRKTGYVVLDDDGNEESTYPSREQAQTRIRALRFPAAWRKRIAAKLPSNLTPPYRNALVLAMAESIVIWLSIEPEIEPDRIRRAWLAGEVDRLEKTLKRVSANLSKGGANAALLGGNSPEGRLSLTVARAAHDIKGWNRLCRPAKARPQSFSVALSKRLHGDFVMFCGTKARGFGLVLKEIERAHSLLQRLRQMPPLPKLNVSALEKRKHRATKKDKVG